MSEITKAISVLNNAVVNGTICPNEGLTEELFLLVSSLVPIVNIDLFVTNNNHELLLAWRSDLHHGSGWHIPGGCVRMKETLKERVERTSLNELGTIVEYNSKPILVQEDINHVYRPGLYNQLERAHGISFLYDCKFPDDYCVPEQYNGSVLKWFDRCPENLLEVHKRLYSSYIEQWFS